jgi:hypothetical protein
LVRSLNDFVNVEGGDLVGQHEVSGGLTRCLFFKLFDHVVHAVVAFVWIVGLAGEDMNKCISFKSLFGKSVDFAADEEEGDSLKCLLWLICSKIWKASLIRIAAGFSNIFLQFRLLVSLIRLPTNSGAPDLGT